MSGYNTELESIVRELNKSPRTATDGPGDEATAVSPKLDPSASLSSLDQLLAYASRHGASDIILVAGSGLVLRINGSLTQSSGRPFSDDDIRSLMLPPADRAAPQGTRARTLHRFQLRARRYRALSNKHSLPAGYDGRGHPAPP